VIAARAGVRILETNSVVEFSRSGHERGKTRPSSGRKTGTLAMTFTGTLIEDLMTTVERAEQRSHSDEPLFAETLAVEPWFASIQESADYDSKLLGVA
jgi:hypothetical protein